MTSTDQIRRWPLGFLAIPILAVALAACGSQGASEETATAATPSNSSTLRIGLQGPLSGSQAELGQGMLQGAELAAHLADSFGHHLEVRMLAQQQFTDGRLPGSHLRHDPDHSNIPHPVKTTG